MHRTLALLLALAIATPALAGVNVPPPKIKGTYDAIVVRVIDGDTVIVTVPAWASTPFATRSVRIYGIDTPESHMPPGKCAAEVALGQAAANYGKTLTKAGDKVRIGFVGDDKYGGRIDATLQLPNGHDWGATMITTKHAAPYDGATKQSWC